MAGDPLSAALSALAVKRSVEHVVDDLYAHAKDSLKAHLRTLKVRKSIDQLATKLSGVRFVKTIWQVDKEVDLFGFYWPAKIDYEGKRLSVTDLSQIPYEKSIIIQGTVGMGKSIFARYLTCQELIRSRTIPIFSELRKIRENSTLLDLLLEDIRSLGFKADNELFTELCASGKVILFLDGFDEIPESRRSDVVSELESLIKTHDQLRIVVTSRPHSGIEASSFFRVVRLSPLQGDEYKHVIRKICDDEVQRTGLLKGIAQHVRIRGVLTTPLMVTLLVFRYRYDHTIPQNIASFYGELFGVLLLRHDKSKPGYVRPRSSGASDGLLQEVFDSFCFLTRKNDKTGLISDEARVFSGEAIRICGSTIDPDQFIEDIVKITCLLQKEGDELRFIHKSVQEYHAARFVKSRPSDIAKKFYDGMTLRWQTWRQELIFLTEIDEYRCAKWFLRPQFLELLGVSRLPDQVKLSEDAVLRIFGDDLVSWESNHIGLRGFLSNSDNRFFPLSDFGFSVRLKHYVQLPLALIEAEVNSGRIVPQPGFGPPGKELRSFALKQVFHLPKAKEVISRMASELLSEILRRAKSVDAFIERIEKSTDLFVFP